MNKFLSHAYKCLVVASFSDVQLYVEAHPERQKEGESLIRLV